MLKKKSVLWRAAFTLVELLVVVAIIGILIAMLLPAIQAAREAARRSSCSNNLRQFGLGVHNYTDQYKQFPPGCQLWWMGSRPHENWQVAILPFMDNAALYDAIDHRLWIDPTIALIVAAHIAWTGADLVRRSFNGLMDHALPAEEQARVRAAIEAHLEPGMDYHALRTRQAGTDRFADFHLLVPGSYTVSRAHALSERIEEAVRAALPGIEVTVHVEPVEDRVNDGVSTVIVGGNDWAGAWAVDAQGRPANAVVPGGEPQREMAYRFGVNLVMYCLTGNYKTDQVHVPAILERLGQ